MKLLFSRRRALSALLSLAFLASSAAAGSAQEGEGVPLPRPRPSLGQVSISQANALNAVNAYFNGIRTLTGEFLQIGPGPDEVAEGTFVVARPGLIRLDYDPPSELVIISNGITLSIEDAARRTQNFYRLERTPLAPLLAQYTDLTSDENVRDVILDSEEYIIVVLSAAEDGGWLTLYFDRETYELRQWVTTDARGNTITFMMFETVLNQPVDAANFVIVNRPFDDD